MWITRVGMKFSFKLKTFFYVETIIDMNLQTIWHLAQECLDGWLGCNLFIIPELELSYVGGFKCSKPELSSDLV